MTDEEIDVLPPGREMDAIVEEVVFNAKYLDPYAGGILVPASAQLPHYSTDIAAAWKLAEMFKMTITPKTDRTQNSQWLADVRLCSSKEPWLAFGITASLAICRAALKVVEHRTM